MSASIKFLDLSTSSWPAFVSHLETNTPRQTKLHAHFEAQLLCCERGVIWTQTKEFINFIPPLRGIWWPSQVSHAATSDKPFMARTLYVRPELCSEFLGQESHCIYISSLLREMLKYAAGFDYKREPRESEIRFLLTLVDQIGEQKIDDNRLPKPNDARLKRAQQFILNSEGETDTSLENVAKMSAVSGRQLNRLLTAEFEKSFTEWRRDLLVYRSILLLERGSSITAVGYDSGFNSPSSFSRAFKRIKGISPKEYQESFLVGNPPEWLQDRALS